MDSNWEARFKYKFEPLQQQHKKPRGAVGISLKFRVPGGFYPWQSQEVFDKIKQALNDEPFKSAGAIVVQHETGPEILFWGLSVGKAALIIASAALAVNTANLIINVRKKEKAQGPIQVLYRGGTDGNYQEDSLVQTDAASKVKKIEFEQKIDKLMDQWFKEDQKKVSHTKPAKKKATKKPTAKKAVKKKPTTTTKRKRKAR
jgi:hypothetical protein